MVRDGSVADDGCEFMQLGPVGFLGSLFVLSPTIEEEDDECSDDDD